MELRNVRYLIFKKCASSAKIIKYNMKTLGFNLYDIPDNGKFDEFVIEQVKKGSKWETVTIKKNVVSAEHYLRSIYHAVAAGDRKNKAYTSYGYIVVRATGISPTKKHRTIFEYWPTVDHRSPKF